MVHDAQGVGGSSPSRPTRKPWSKVGIWLGLVLRLRVGDRIGLTEAQSERLAEAFLAEIESKFV
jgi:hypothetical protein